MLILALKEYPNLIPNAEEINKILYFGGHSACTKHGQSIKDGFKLGEKIEWEIVSEFL